MKKKAHGDLSLVCYKQFANIYIIDISKKMYILAWCSVVTSSCRKA